MNVNVDRVDSKTVKLEVTVGADEVKKAIRKSYEKNVKDLNIQGFRKGKAPMSIVKRQYGVEFFYDDASNILLNDSYGKALDETDISPLDYPNVDIVQLEEGKDFIYTATVEVYPEFDLPEYKGLEVVKPSYPTNDEDIENELKSLQSKNERIETKEDGEIKDGDIAVINFVGKIDGEEFEGGSGEKFELTIGSKSFIGDFEDQLIGLKVEDEKTVTVTFPEDYGMEELQNKEADFDVKVLEIKAKELPKLDDEFASEVSEFETLEELRASIKEGLEQSNKDREDAELNNNLIHELSKKTKIDIPNAMIEESLNRQVQDFEQRLTTQGMNKELYLQMTGQDEESIREMFKESAENQVTGDILINAIIEKEEISANEEEMENKAVEISKMYGEQNDEIKEMLLTSNKEVLEREINTLKALNVLKETAVFVEPKEEEVKEETEDK